MIKNLAVSLLALTLLPLQAAQAGPLLKSTLSGAQTVTDTTVGTATLPVTGLVTGSLGTAEFLLSPDRRALAYTLKVSVMPATAIFMAHIHLGPVGANGPVLFWLYGDPNLDPPNSPVPPNQFPRNDGPFTGQISGVLTAADFDPDPSQGVRNFEEAVKNILAGNAYTNVHTVQYPAGETRGQIETIKK
ncbi:CHRD domain-containing protein [Methylococcus mesophilus]|uniref:CHRD domain-containing protein n=1 Tax=Methylococcus mesophilus TaxID=2993564 RepID=UPI00224AE3DD|nr:CHRD domain-containing protein [Methylococcus mesophilus]UZR30197.1 CHRD domain-containing protein [Methylococcus mesophilus]